MVEVPTWLIVTLIGLLVLLVLLAAVAIGLWVGHRRSSRTLENLARYGQPSEPQRAERDVRKSLEEEVVEDIENRAVDQLANDLQRRASRIGKNISEEEARQEAERLIREGFAKAGGAE